MSSERQVKKQKTDDFMSLQISTCKHFVIRKKRLCKMTVSKGQEYCGEHLPTKESCLLDINKNQSKKHNTYNRIACPLDPKHTVYSNKLQKHLKICNAKQGDLPDYIESGMNFGSDDDYDEDNKYINKDELKLAQMNELDLNELANKINLLYQQYIKPTTIEEQYLNHEILNDELSNAEYGMETLKHLSQTSSILGHLNNLNYFTNNTTYIDFGGGKGKFAYWLAQTVKDLLNCNIILIDKASHRHKQDNKILDKDLINRVRVDIGDLNIYKLLTTIIESGTDNNLKSNKEHRQCIGIGKHLCGAATDLTIRCILNGNKKNLGNESMSYKTNGFIIALCCHHRCTWKSFTGKEFFKENNISIKEFILITKMVGWAVCGNGQSREKNKARNEGKYDFIFIFLPYKLRKEE